MYDIASHKTHTCSNYRNNNNNKPMRDNSDEPNEATDIGKNKKPKYHN